MVCSVELGENTMRIRHTTQSSLKNLYTKDTLRAVLCEIYAHAKFRLRFKLKLLNPAYPELPEYKDPIVSAKISNFVTLIS